MMSLPKLGPFPPRGGGGDRPSRAGGRGVQQTGNCDSAAGFGTTAGRPCRALRTTGVVVPLAVLAMLALRTWCVQGLLVPVRVVSGSMGDALPGPHWDVTCQDCGRRFACGTDCPPEQDIVCPNCGTLNPLARAVLRPGRRVLIDRLTMGLRRPRRWEVVVARLPGNPPRLAVKRVVGLPGERIRIHDGDIYANGTMVRKDLKQQRKMAVLVHDNQFLPVHETRARARWIAESDASRWQNHCGRFRFTAVRQHREGFWNQLSRDSAISGPPRACLYGEQGPRLTTACNDNSFLRSPAAGGGRRPKKEGRRGQLALSLRPDSPHEQARGGLSSWDPRPSTALPVRAQASGDVAAVSAAERVARDRLDWLVYHHRPCLPMPGGSERQLPITDNYGYNQGLSRNLFETTDVLLSCRVRLSGRGVLAVLAHDGHETFQVQWVPNRKQIALFRKATAVAVAVADLPGTWLDRPVRLEMMICDAQVQLALDGQAYLAYTYAANDFARQPTASPLAVGVAGLTAEIDQLRVWRDVYYTHPDLVDCDWSLGRPLGEDEYLLLGDNSPISVDGRHGAAEGRVSRAAILGRVMPQPSWPGG